MAGVILQEDKWLYGGVIRTAVLRDRVPVPGSTVNFQNQHALDVDDAALKTFAAVSCKLGCPKLVGSDIHESISGTELCHLQWLRRVKGTFAKVERQREQSGCPGTCST